MILTRRSFLGGFAASLWGFCSTASRAASESLALRVEPFAARLGYNGDSPGPLLRLRSGASLRLDFENALTEPTALSFPGLRAENAALFAGKPRIAANEKRSFVLAPPESGFNIYGAVLGPDPGRQFARGLYGPLIVEEPAPPDVDLEVIALVSDWRYDPSGVLNLGDEMAEGRQGGRLGDALTVKGAPIPAHFVAPPGGRVRLRLANCATARIMSVAFNDFAPQVIAVDGQPSEVFSPRHNLLPVVPGARFELIFDVPRIEGAEVRVLLKTGEAVEPALLIVTAHGELARDRSSFAGLPANPALPKEIALERARRVNLTITGGGAAPLKFEGVPAAGPAFTAKRGEPVALAFANKTPYPQTIRLTGHVARVLHELDDGWEPYWRDIFAIPPGKSLHAAFVADNPGLWPLESASPECRAAGLATRFQVD